MSNETSQPQTIDDDTLIPTQCLLPFDMDVGSALDLRGDALGELLATARRSRSTVHSRSNCLPTRLAGRCAVGGYVIDIFDRSYLRHQTRELLPYHRCVDNPYSV